MVIISGMSILNPTARALFDEDVPFYDKKTDAIDFKKLSSYIYELKHSRGKFFDKECKKCIYADFYEDSWNQIFELRTDYDKNPLSYYERTELETLRELFLVLTGENDYYYSSDVKRITETVKSYQEAHFDIDETISNFENKILQKNKEIERLQLLLDENPVKEVVKFVEKEPKKDTRPITRSSKIYNKFKLHVLKRDEVCQCCGSTENLHVHHLSSYKHDKQRRADTCNGIVLCEDCHNQFHSLYGKGHKNNPVNFAKFMREYGQPMQVNLDYTIKNDDILLEGK